VEKYTSIVEKLLSTCKKYWKNIYYLLICQSEHFNHTPDTAQRRTVLGHEFLPRLVGWFWSAAA